MILGKSGRGMRGRQERERKKGMIERGGEMSVVSRCCMMVEGLKEQV